MGRSQSQEKQHMAGVERGEYSEAQRNYIDALTSLQLVEEYYTQARLEGLSPDRSKHPMFVENLRIKEEALFRWAYPRMLQVTPRGKDRLLLGCYFFNHGLVPDLRPILIEACRLFIPPGFGTQSFLTPLELIQQVKVAYQHKEREVFSQYE